MVYTIIVKYRTWRYLGRFNCNSGVDHGLHITASKAIAIG